MSVANDVRIPLNVVVTLFPAGLTARSLGAEIARQSGGPKDLLMLWRRAILACEIEQATREATA